MPFLSISTQFLSNKLLYLDPGTGSYLLQILLASLLGGIFAIKVYWKKITGFFSRSKSENQITPEPLNDNDDDSSF